ncbi:hypothetical protein QAD02_000226 [Eretmocerus hayati]|uniref:Uncharacterized protein n=1 Tax=Eretmocerus hayati TaxID=131215 RepID=A0ACC2NFD6_9HYME|nr:hypothetical protein QAD02_000226 [Eretmocerus hayati]
MSAVMDRFPKGRGASGGLVKDIEAYKKAHLSPRPIDPVSFYRPRECRIMRAMGPYTATVEKGLIESTYVTDRYILEKFNSRGHEYYHMHEVQTLLGRGEEEGFLKKHRRHIWLVNCEEFIEIKGRHDTAVRGMRKTFDTGEEIPKLRGNLKKPVLSFHD